MTEIKLKLKQKLGSTDKNQEEANNSDIQKVEKIWENTEKKLGISSLKKEKLSHTDSVKKEENISPSEVEKEEEPIIIKKSNKISLSSLISKKKEPIKQKEEEEEKEKEENKKDFSNKNIKNTSWIIPQKEEKKIFWNYKSHFEKKSKSILDRFKNFKRIPQTHFWILGLLIFITVITIGWLMYLNPEKHSFSIYKANILDAYHTNIKIFSSKKEKTNIETSEKKIEKKEITQPKKEIIPEEKNKEKTKKTNISKNSNQITKDYILKKYSK